ncbi:MAG: hypothetical protein IJE23_03620 [Tyzzerella sp.]|nr:hypothetical protein [Tyzzerella sp.]
MRKQRILTILLAVMLCITGLINWKVEAQAEAESTDVEMSDIMTEDALIGYAGSQTRGAYFSDGRSIINKISATKIGAGGVTNANVKCKVTVTAIVERRNSSGSWERVTSWSVTNANAYTAMASKSLTVASGYYYRVRSYHYASSDSATSHTDALWVGN